MYLRPGTFDFIIFQMVYTNNEYRLPPSFSTNDVVLDIGMHIGCFTLAALERGCGVVYGFEADIVNFEIARSNLGGVIESGRAEVFNKAVWRSDIVQSEVRFSGYTRPNQYVNTGAGNVLFASGTQSCEAVPFDQVVEMATRHEGRPVRLLKIDCEGSEWPILLTSRRLSSIEEICGEFHEFGGMFDQNEVPFDDLGGEPLTVEVLEAHLRSHGFDFTYERERHPFSGELAERGIFFSKNMKIWKGG